MSHIKSRKLAPAPARPVPAAPAFASVLAGVALCCPVAAQAQAMQTDSSVTTMPEVTVSGAAQNTYKPDSLASPKFTQPLVDTTQTVTVINQQLIKDQQATTLTEALRNVPGVGAFYAGENGSTSTGDAIYMRGIDTSQNIFIDGIRDTSGVFHDLFNVEQVEVIEGPSGSDYGRSAPSGSINMVSKQPYLDNSFNYSAALGSDSYKRTTLDWNEKLSDTMALRLNAFGYQADVPGRDKVENGRWGVAPELAWGLGTPTRVYLDIYHVKQVNVPDGGVPTIGLPGYSAPSAALGFMSSAPKADPSNFYGTESDHDYSTTDTETLRVEHDFSPDTTLRNISRWSQTTQNYLLTSFLAAPANLDIPNQDDLNSWTMTRNPNTKDVNNKLLTNQTNLTSKFETGSLKHDISTGFELSREEQTNFGVVTPVEPPVSIYAPDSNVGPYALTRNGANAYGKTDTAAAYLFDTVDVGSSWQVNGGIRLDHYRTIYNSKTACGGSGRTVVSCGGSATGTPIETVNTSTSGNLVDWKLGALYRLTPHGNLYVNYGVSQQPPGGTNFALATETSSPNSANRVDFAPEKAETAEVGTKWELFDERLLATGALFRTEIKNDVEENTDGTFSQTAKKVVQGVQLGAVGQITPAWSVSAGYIYQNAIVSQGPSVTQDGSGSLSYTPRNAFTLWTTYKLPRGFTVGAGARYTGGLQRGTDAAVGTPDTTQAYWVFDNMISYQVNPHLSFQVNGYNLFNRDYVASINKSGYRYFPGASRSVVLTANLSY